MDYTSHFGTKETPQTQPIPGSTQVANSAGGFSFAVDEFTRLRRFLILGTEGGTYYASERDITRENAKSIMDAIKKDGLRVVQEVIDISQSGRAPKNDPALFVLAMCTDPKLADARTRSFAIDSLQKVARTPTHLFHFAKFMQAFRGWGRLARRGVRNYYLNTPLDKLAHQVVKYPQRDGWSHADLLRLTHPKAEDETRNALFKYIVDGNVPEIPIIKATEALKKETNEKEIIKLLKEFNLPMEVVPTERRSAAIYEAVIDNNGMEWLVRNLGNLTKHGVIGNGKFDANGKVIEKLTNPTLVTQSRLHPIKVLAALLTYEQGHGMRGNGSWEVVADVVDALNESFHLAFGNVVPTGKRILWGFDVSGSMTMGTVAGIPGLDPRTASAALAMVTYKTEKNFLPMAFCDRFVDLNISRAQRLDDVCNAMNRLPFGGTDCSLPMEYAIQKNLDIDAFVVTTDSETYAGRRHPKQALEAYRQKTGIPAKLIVVGMVANNFSIADPSDAGMMDVVGFDTATPNLMNDFMRGDI